MEKIYIRCSYTGMRNQFTRPLYIIQYNFKLKHTVIFLVQVLWKASHYKGNVFSTNGT